MLPGKYVDGTPCNDDNGARKMVQPVMVMGLLKLPEPGEEGRDDTYFAASYECSTQHLRKKK
ncbi:exonuclease protein [Anopheles sinensis]|uniref:Exonuclease protein n=1 Tax=Anopheles sinensis TaxID=74873 RepID=A0A084WEU7_ANOSI|nr:exonuclease protein [Anopheles sinensis]